MDEVSFVVEQGEVFGLLGPNGAGKTTTIRMLMDIIKPDGGRIRILGEPPGPQINSRLGYLPEERGLYRKVTVMGNLVYLASLKGMNPHHAKEKGKELLERIGLSQHQNRRLEELSRGMQQKLQFLVTIVHDPDLLVLDEPFAGLDPLNVRLIKDFIHEFRYRGKTVLLSSHQMNLVEEMCDRIMMIDRGRSVLYGQLSEIKERFRENAILLDCQGEPKGLRGVRRVAGSDGHWQLFLESGFAPQVILRQLGERPELKVSRFELATPSLEDIFIAVAEGRR